MCVPTPLTEHREPDLSYVENTAKAAAPWVREGQLVVLESTTYPGTTEELMIPVLEAGNTQGLKVQGPGTTAEHGVFYVAFSPERYSMVTEAVGLAEASPPARRRASRSAMAAVRCGMRTSAFASSAANVSFTSAKYLQSPLTHQHSFA